MASSKYSGPLIGSSQHDLSDELIELYMTHKKLTDIRNLQIIHANILYFAKYDEPLYPQTLDQFGPDRLAAFVAGHSELVKYHVAFMNSTQLYMYTQMEEELKEKGEYQKTDQTFPQLGFALLRLFGLEEFMPIFLAKNPPLADQIYFVRYFEEPMFSGKPLYVHFHHENNMYAGLLLAVAQMDVEKLTQLQDELLSD